MKLKIEVKHAAETPPMGYGVAYHDFYRQCAICYPIPLNLLIGVLRRLYLWMERGIGPTKREAYENRISYMTRTIQQQWRKIRELEDMLEQSDDIPATASIFVSWDTLMTRIDEFNALLKEAQETVEAERRREGENNND